MGRGRILDRKSEEFMFSERDLEDLDWIEGRDYKKGGLFSYDEHSRRFVRTESGKFSLFRLLNREEKYMS